MTILRMYYTPESVQRPTHYREAWWEEDTGEFVLHHGKVGEPGTTTVEHVSDSTEADPLLASFAQHNATEGYIDVEELTQEQFRVLIRYRGSDPTQAEQTNAEKFAREYTGLLGWRGLGDIAEWNEDPALAAFVFHIEAVHRAKAAKYAAEAIKQTDFRADRMKIERT